MRHPLWLAIALGEYQPYPVRPFDLPIAPVISLLGQEQPVLLALSSGGRYGTWAFRKASCFPRSVPAKHETRTSTEIHIQVLPFVTPLTYFFLLPRPTAFLSLSPAPYEEDASAEISPQPYSLLATAPDLDEEDSTIVLAGPKKGFALTALDKWSLVKPLLLKYMLPLCKPIYD
jgi:hypothetical protein